MFVVFLKTSRQVKELFHGDFIVFGSSACFFVSFDNAVVCESHRVLKLPTWWALGPKERTKIMQQILTSEATSHQLQVALHYMSVLQSQNLDFTNFKRLDQFLATAKRAAALVSEEPLTGGVVGSHARDSQEDKIQ